MIAIVNKGIEHKSAIIALLQEQNIHVLESHTYSLQVDTIPDNSVSSFDTMILCGIGVRYDDAREFVHNNALVVYRINTSDELASFLAQLKNNEDMSAYLADLNER